MIPSLLQIPSAVSDSKLHSVLPNNGKGDFQFDRSTGATRINKDGLIEEVGYFSSELVQNGNFSELGSELVTNGGFSTNSDWVLPTGWSINNGKAIANFSGGATGRLTQNISFVQNKTYKVVFTISDYEQGNIRIEFRQGGGNTISGGYTGNGTHTLYQVAAQNHTQLSIRGLGDAVLKVDNISVKQVDPNDRWTLETGWSYGDNRLNFTTAGSSNRACSSSAGITNGKTYKLSFNVLSISAGQVSLRFGGMAGVDEITATSTGVHSGIITANSSANGNVQIEDNDNNFVGSITDVSVVEVQGDRPRLSYDITNGVVEDTPHLLLEPSSTNLAKFSYDIQAGVDSGDYLKGTNSVLTYVSDIEAPDGTMGVYRIQNAAQSGTFLSFYTGSSKSVSVYVKAVDVNNDNQFSLYSPSGHTVFTATNRWERYNIEHAQSSGNTGINNEGDAYASDVYIWGAQVENANSYATSLIPTAGTTITRAAETCNNSKPSVNSTEGVLYAEIQAFNGANTDRQISLSDGTTSNRVGVAFLSNGTQIQFVVVSGGSVTMNTTKTIATITDGTKLAVSYKANDFKIYSNGVLLSTDTSGAVPSGLNEFAFDRGDDAENFYGKVKGVAVYNEALSESQLMQLTGVTASSIYNNFVTRTASFTVEALNEVKKVIDNL